MPNVLDENVVILKFDNSDFKKNTADSVKSLDNLKASLKDSKGADGLEALGKAANTIDLSGIGKSIDTINSRFSTMGIIGMSAINKLTSSAISSVANIARAIPSQLIQGGWKRALNIEQAEYLMKGLGYSFEGTYDKITKEFTGVKGAVLAAVDDTAYGLDEAAKLAATFLASGVKDTNELARRLKAVSGVAAVTSSDFSEVGRIFAQVAGQGRMMGDDLNQLSDKGFNAAQEIVKYLNANKDVKNSALEAAIASGRQVKAMQEIQTHSKITEADVRQMVSAGAISFDIMANSLEHFFETAQEANKTYSGSFANVRAALSRMGAQLEEPKLKNMTRIFNTLLPILKNLETIIEPFTKKIADASNKVTDFINEGILNPLATAIGVDPSKLFHGFSDAVKKTGEESKKTGKETKNLGDKIKVTAKEWQAALDIWNKGTYGTGRRREKEIEKLGMSYEHVQGIIDRFYKNKFDWEKTKSAYDIGGKSKSKTEETKEDTKAIEENTDRLYEQTQQLSTFGKAIKGVVNFAKAFKNALNSVAQIFKYLWTNGKGLLGILSSGLMTVFLKISEIVLSISEKFLLLTKALNGNKDAIKEIQKNYPTLGSILEKVISIMSSVVGVAKKVASGVKNFLTSFKDNKALQNFGKSLSTLVNVILSKVVDIIDKIYFKFKKLSDSFLGNTSFGELLAKVFTKIINGISNFLLALSGAPKVAGSFMSALGSIAHDILSAFSPVVDWLLDTFFAALETVFDFFTKLGESSGVQSLKNTLHDLADALFEVEQPMDNMVGSINALGGATDGSVLDKIVTFFSNIAQGISNFIVAVSKGKNPLEIFTKTFRKVKDSFSFDGIIDYLQSTFGATVGKGFAAAFKVYINTLMKIKDFLIEIDALDKLSKAGKYVADSLGVLFDWFKDYPWDQLLDKIKNLDYEKLSKVAMFLSGAFAMFKGAMDLGKVANSAVGMFKSIGDAFKSFGSIANTIKTSIKLKSFESLSIAIAILIGSIIALAMVPTDRLKPAIAVVGMIMAALTGIMIAMNSPYFDAAKLHAIGVAFAGVGAGIMLIATSMMLISRLKVSEIAKAGGTIVAFMLIMALIASKAKKMVGVGAAFMGLAIAVNLLVTAIYAFALMPLTVLARGGVAILAFMVALSGAARIAKSSNPGGFLAMAAALNLLVPAIVMMALIPTDMLEKGGIAIVGLMTALALAARIANGANVSGLGKMAIVVAVLAASALALSFVKPERIKAAATALSAMMVALGIAAKGATGSTGAILSMALLIGIIAGALITLEKLAPETATKNALAIAACIAAMGLIIALLGKLKVNAAGAANAALDIGVFVSVLAAIMLALGSALAGIAKAIDTAIGKDGATLKFFTEQALPMLEAAGEAIGKFFGAMGHGFATAGNADSLGNKFVDSVESLTKMIEAVKQMNKGDLAKLLDFTTAINQLGTYNLKNSLGNFFSEQGGYSLADQMEDFNNGLHKLTEGTKDLGKDDISRAQLAADIFATFAHGMNELPATFGLATIWSNKQLGGFGGFGSQMKSFAKDLGKFINNMDDVPLDKLKGIFYDDGKGSKIGLTMKLVSTLANADVPTTGIKQSLFDGVKSISKFGEEMEGFGGSMVAFIQEMDQVPLIKLKALTHSEEEGQDKLSLIMALVRKLNGLQKELAPSGGLEQAEKGNTTLAEFARDLSGWNGFGANIKSFIDTISTTIDADRLADATKKIEPIATIVSELGKVASTDIPTLGGAEGFLAGDEDLGLFGEQLGRFAQGFSKFDEYAKDFNPNDDYVGKIKAMAAAVSAMAEIQPPEETGGVYQWARETVYAAGINNLVKVVSAINKATIGKNGDIDVTENVKKMKAAVDELVTIKSPSDGFLDALAKWATTKLDTSGLGALVDSINTASSIGNKIETAGIAKLSTAISSIKTSTTTLRGLGSIPTAAGLPTLAKNVKSFADKMSKISTAGIVKNAENVAKAAKKLESTDLSGAADSLSGSGKDLGSSMAKGLSSAASSVKNAAKSLVNAAKGAIKTNALHGVGANLAQGFAAGMRSCSSQVIAAARAMEEAAERAVRAKAKVKSPSRVFMKIGAYMGEGLAKGLVSYSHKVYQASNKMATESVIAANEAMNALNMYGEPTITPVLDLTDVRRGAKQINALVTQSQAIAVNANVNSAASSYATPWMLADLMDKFDSALDVKVKNPEQMGVTFNNTFHIDGAENPESFATRFAQQLELEMRNM